MSGFNCVEDCPIPGACCRGFLIGSLSGLHKDTVERRIKQNGLGHMNIVGYTENQTPVLVCPWLDSATGLCLDYEQRPTTCRVYTPCTDPLCAAFCGPAIPSGLDEVLATAGLSRFSHEAKV